MIYSKVVCSWYAVSTVAANSESLTENLVEVAHERVDALRLAKNYKRFVKSFSVSDLNSETRVRIL